MAFSMKVFNDPIHGQIELHPLCVEIVDTPEFQRLRDIKQLGGCYFVYPGASHNRFEHSIGVSHLAGQLVRTLQLRQPELSINETDVLCVEIAGLCHDLGHGPFSHLFDQMFVPQANPERKDWTHEDASAHMLDYLIEKHHLKDEFKKYELTDLDIEFIKEQIVGQQKKSGGKTVYQGRPDKPYLYEVVANKRNGIDVDKWDYFARDSYHLGIKGSFDHKRFMTFVRVIEVDGEKQICTRDKEVENLYEMFHTRSRLFRRAYLHKVTKIVEVMICEAFLAADKFLIFKNSKGQEYRLSQTVDDMEVYSKVTDNVFYQILYSTDANLDKARQILNNILNRQLYKCVGETIMSKITIPPKTLEEIQKWSNDLIESYPKDEMEPLKVKSTDFRIQVFKLNYGMGDKNPINAVRFYQKSNLNQAAEIRKEQVSNMLPENFQEHLFRLYLTNADPVAMNQAKICFQMWCCNKQFAKPRGYDLPPDLTPCKNPTEGTNVTNHEVSPVKKRLCMEHNSCQQW